MSKTKNALETLQQAARANPVLAELGTSGRRRAKRTVAPTVLEAIKIWESISADRVANPCGRWPVLPDLVNGLRSDIETLLRTTNGRVVSIHRAIEGLNGAVREFARDLRDNGVQVGVKLYRFPAVESAPVVDGDWSHFAE